MKAVRKGRAAVTLGLAATLAVAGCGEGPTVPVPNHQYTVPEQTGDGWITADAADVGMDTELLERMADRIEDGSYTNLHSVLLVRHGLLVFEAYFPGRTTATNTWVEWGRDVLHPQASVTKSVNSALVGIAIDQGLIPGVDALVSDYFPEHADLFVGPKAGLTLRHLLTMSAGLEWDEKSEPYTSPGNSHVQMNRSGDPVGFTLGLPVVAQPGETFCYNSGLSIVLGEIVHRVSGMSTDAFAEQYLFGPLGITDYAWEVYPNGVVQTGGGLRLTPRSMARIGQLYLDGGVWADSQVVATAWVDASTTWQAPGVRYGYQWWGVNLNRHDNAFDLSDEVLEAVAANGRGGQWILYYPDLDLVVVFTGGNDNDLQNQPLDILRRFIFPAIEGS